ncbi:hypothetical protein ANRL2_00901 [Anaerolineae bacterium]|nr:hypothetical protein ANRL2_00901 [Anaerolineae bacterium]
MTRWVPLDKGLLRDLPKDRPYTRLEAMFCLSCDYDNDKPATLRGYASLWRWSTGKVERFLKEIGVRLEYPETTGQKTNQRGTIMSTKPRQSRDNDGTINFIDSKALSGEARQGRDNDETKARQSRGATQKPITLNKFSIPTLDEVRAYCLERGNGIDPEAWHNHYGAKGWMIGKAPMKDWKAAVRTWEKSATSPPAPVQSGGHPTWY